MRVNFFRQLFRGLHDLHSSIERANDAAIWFFRSARDNSPSADCGCRATISAMMQITMSSRALVSVSLHLFLIQGAVFDPTTATTTHISASTREMTGNTPVALRRSE
jgi:hypothetical protein